MSTLSKMFSINTRPMYQSFLKLEHFDWKGHFHPQTKAWSILRISKFTKFYSSQKKDGDGLQLPVAVDLAYHKYQDPFVPDDTIPIIILHGLLGAKSNWHSMARQLFKSTYNRKVITLDARNHGDSPHVPDFSYDIMVCDLLKFMDNQEISKASLIGHSLGGRVAMLMSLLYPEKVQSLVVVDISPVSQSPNLLTLPEIFKALMGLEIDPRFTLREARKYAAAQLKEQIKDEQLVMFLLTNLVEKRESNAWRWKFNIHSINENFYSEVCKFPVPNTQFDGRTLFVGGTKSDYLRKVDEPKILELFTAAQFAYIEGAGHWVHADKPKEFLDVVTHFLRQDGPVTH